MKIFVAYYAVISIMISSLLLSSCGSDNSAGINTDVSTTKTSEIKEIDLYITNHKFEPSEIKIPKNTKIKLTVHNTDDTIEEFESIDLRREKIIPAKSKINIIIAPLATGIYEFFGDFNPDTAKGRLIVE